MADFASPVERNIITILSVDMVGSTRHIAGCDPEDLEIGRADLEDVFIEIMRGETPQRVAA